MQALLTLVRINVVITVLGPGFISWQGHLGGFVGGLVLGAVLVYAPRERRTAWQVAARACVSPRSAIALARRADLTAAWPSGRDAGPDRCDPESRVRPGPRGTQSAGALGCRGDLAHREFPHWG